MAGDLENSLRDFGGAVSSLFASRGSTAAASSYTEAAAIAEQNALLAKTATAIQETQESRQIYKVLGKQRADIGGAGFAQSGTALDLLRDSASQGALTKAMTAEQGAITENSYAAQAGMYSGLARAARSAGTGSEIGGILQAAGGIENAAKGVKSLFDLFPGSAPTTAGVDISTASGAASADIALGGQGGSAGADLITGAGAGAGVELSTAGAADAAGASAGAALDAASIDAGATAAAGAAEGVAAGAATEVAAGAAVESGVAAAATSSALEEGAVMAIAAWVVCTELHRQGRMPSRIYYSAASSFLAYPERGKRGYYVWAIPSVRHLRAHPQSRYSRLLERTFNCRARYLSDRRRGRPTTLTGALVTHGLFTFCWALSWFIPESFALWQALYKA